MRTRHRLYSPPTLPPCVSYSLARVSYVHLHVRVIVNIVIGAVRHAGTADRTKHHRLKGGQARTVHSRADAQDRVKLGKVEPAGDVRRKVVALHTKVVE